MAKQHDNSQQETLQNHPCDDPARDYPARRLKDLPSYDPDSLIQQTIRLYDDLGEVTALHNWIYDALHAQLLSDAGFEVNYHDLGLSLLFDWLKQRDQATKDNLQQLLEQLQAAYDTNSLEQPRALYCVAAA